MNAAIDNWADVRGRIEEVSPTEDGAEHLRVYLTVVDPVPGFPNPLEHAIGEVITVRVPLEGDKRPAPGDALRGRVGRARPDLWVVHPGQWSVEPAPHEY
jgi:hypothetical protein